MLGPLFFPPPRGQTWTYDLLCPMRCRYQRGPHFWGTVCSFPYLCHSPRCQTDQPVTPGEATVGCSMYQPVMDWWKVAWAGPFVVLATDSGDVCFQCIPWPILTDSLCDLGQRTLIWHLAISPFTRWYLDPCTCFSGWCSVSGMEQGHYKC